MSLTVPEVLRSASVSLWRADHSAHLQATDRLEELVAIRFADGVRLSPPVDGEQLARLGRTARQHARIAYSSLALA